MAQRIKRLPAMQETWVRSLGWEDPLEKEMATHSSILAWRIPWTEEPGRLQSTSLTYSFRSLLSILYLFAAQSVSSIFTSVRSQFSKTFTLLTVNCKT